MVKVGFSVNIDQLIEPAGATSSELWQRVVALNVLYSAYMRPLSLLPAHMHSDYISVASSEIN